MRDGQVPRHFSLFPTRALAGSDEQSLGVTQYVHTEHVLLYCSGEAPVGVAIG